MSCGSSPSSTKIDEEQVNPWEVIIETGNFTINTIPVLIYDDARTVNATNYFAFESDLPSEEFEYFEFYLFVPIRDDVDINLNNIDARVNSTGSVESENIYFSGASLERGVTLFNSDQEYSKFRITSRYTGNESINAVNFNNYHINLEVQFVDNATGEVLHEIQNFYNEVYKRDQ